MPNDESAAKGTYSLSTTTNKKKHASLWIRYFFYGKEGAARSSFVNRGIRVLEQAGEKPLI
jgi:hypothetical protein